MASKAKGIKFKGRGSDGRITFEDCDLAFGFTSLDLEKPAAGFAKSGNPKVAQADWMVLPGPEEGKVLKIKIMAVVVEDKKAKKTA